ncbi:MAG: zf-HC2 domain-containing protein [Planctomycetes bacterium]|nr:zf-HC2 domain-containing protein [Planctomycetota bacterium]
MECRDVNKLMDACLDRRLDAERSRQIQAHLQACDACGREWGGLLALLTDLRPIDVPAGLRDRIVASLDRRLLDPAASPPAASVRTMRWAARLGRWRYAGAIAASVAFFLAGWMISGWWTTSHPTIQPKPGVGPSDQSVTVMISPWLMSSWARLAAMPGPVSPAIVLVEGIVPELMAVPAEADEPPIRIYQRPTSTQPAATTPEPDMRLLPLIPRYLGA